MEPVKDIKKHKLKTSIHKFTTKWKLVIPTPITYPHEKKQSQHFHVRKWNLKQKYVFGRIQNIIPSEECTREATGDFHRDLTMDGKEHAHKIVLDQGQVSC